jgi:hypothetical protein
MTDAGVKEEKPQRTFGSSAPRKEILRKIELVPKSDILELPQLTTNTLFTGVFSKCRDC